MALLATVLSTRTSTRVGAASGELAIRSAQVSAYHDAFLGSVIIAMLCALSIRDADAAITMKPRTSSIPVPEPAH